VAGQYPVDTNWPKLKFFAYLLWQFCVMSFNFYPIIYNFADIKGEASDPLFYYGVDWIITTLVPISYFINVFVLYKNNNARDILDMFYAGNEKEVKEEHKKVFRKKVRRLIFSCVAFIGISTTCYIISFIFIVPDIGNVWQILFFISFPIRLGTVTGLVVYNSAVCIAIIQQIKQLLQLIDGKDIVEKFSIFKTGKKEITNIKDAYDALRTTIVTINLDQQWFYWTFFTIVGSTYPFYLMFLLFKKSSIYQVILLSSWIVPYFMIACLLIYFLASVDFHFTQIPKRINKNFTKTFDATTTHDQATNIWREILMDAFSGCFTLELLDYHITYGMLFTILYTFIPLIVKAIVDRVKN